MSKIRPARCHACKRGDACPCSPPCPPRTGAWIFDPTPPAPPTQTETTTGREIADAIAHVTQGTDAPEAATPRTRAQRIRDAEHRIQTDINSRQEAMKHPVPHGSGLSMDEEHKARDISCPYCGAQIKRGGKWLDKVLRVDCPKSPLRAMNDANITVKS